MEHEQKRDREKLAVRDREPDEITEIDGETDFGDGQERFQRHVFASAPGLRLSLDPIFRCARKIGLVIEDRFEHGAGIIERKTDAQRKQARQKQDFLHPSARMQLALGTNIKHRD